MMSCCKKLGMMDCCKKLGIGLNHVARGIARKVSLLCVGFSFIGWIIYIGGFGAHVSGVDLSSTPARLLFIPYWFTLVAGPAAFVSATLFIILGSRYSRVGKVLESITTLANFLYIAALASPFVFSAKVIFGASGFGDLEDSFTNAIPIKSVPEILGIGNDFTRFLLGLLGILYELLEDGIEATIDSILSVVILKDESFRAAFASQFSGCAISIFFIAASVVLWPFFSDNQSASQSGVRPNRDLRSNRK